MPTTTHSEEEYDEIRNERFFLIDILDKILESFTRKHECCMTLSDRYKHYPFYPRDIHNVYQHFKFLNEYIKEDIHLKFLDVGCGVGNILLFANQCFFHRIDSFGIERDKELSLMARQFVGSYYDSEYVFNMDAFNFKKYQDFDIIYYYCPICDKKLQKKLEFLIEKKMKVGAYLIPFLKQDKSFTVNGNFKRIDKDYEIYVKQKSN